MREWDAGNDMWRLSSTIWIYIPFYELGKLQICFPLSGCTSSGNIYVAVMHVFILLLSLHDLNSRVTYARIGLQDLCLAINKWMWTVIARNMLNFDISALFQGLVMATLYLKKSQTLLRSLGPNNWILFILDALIWPPYSCPSKI